MNEPARIGHSERSRQSIDALHQNVIHLNDAVQSSLSDRQHSTERRRASTAADVALLDKCGEVCHDMLGLRGRDAWSVALAHLINLSIAGLLAAHSAEDGNAAAAMSHNLKTITEGLRDKFPAGRLSVDDLHRRVRALGEDEPTDVAREPHPYADTLARQVQTVRDTGFELRNIRHLYGLVGTKVYRIPPA